MERAPFRNLQVLTVDDEPAIRQIIKANLDGVGYTTGVAESGEAAWLLSGQKNYNIIVSDVRMGKLSGLELGQKLREKDPALALVYITGKPEAKGVEGARRLGAIQYIAKPLNPTELAENVAIAARWNSAQLISRAAERYYALRGQKLVMDGDVFLRIKVEIKNIVIASKDVRAVTEFAYARSPNATGLCAVLDERFGRFARAVR